ncbi:MAG: hypothetical protein WAS21_23245 [Geminicoccaceae bacterium]
MLAVEMRFPGMVLNAFELVGAAYDPPKGMRRLRVEVTGGGDRRIWQCGEK